ncbi:MAG: hypothetical protein ACRD9L_03030, partial [Bryobacteraceae bacterium]
MSSAPKDELTRDMLDRVAREVAGIRQRSGSPIPQADAGRTNLPVIRVQNALLVEAKRLRPVSSNPDSQVGRMPPQPPTFRGEMGAFLVRPVRRALFWYSQQINEIVAKIAEVLFHQAQNLGDVLTTAAKNSETLERLPGAIAGVARDLATLQASVRQQENRLEQVPGAVAGVARDLAALQ